VAKVLKSYYGWNYIQDIDNTKSETNVEVLTADGNKYSGNFRGVNHAKQAIGFVNSILALVGKTDIIYCKTNTYFYQWVEVEDTKAEE